MAAFASVALFRRDGQMTFRHPVKQVQENTTQARKSAARLWQGAIKAPDRLSSVIVVCGDANQVTISEKSPSGRWSETLMPSVVAADQPHLAACLALLGIDATAAPKALPEVIEINGIVYRREI